MFRRTALAMMSCAAGLALTACSAGITNASQPPATGHAASAPQARPSHSASPKPSPSPSAANTIRLSAQVSHFPAPPKVHVLNNQSCPKQISVYAGPVTPAHAVAFYSTALPRAGYTITSTTSFGSGQALVQLIIFSGHHYTGQIGIYANMTKAMEAGGPGGGGPTLSPQMANEMTALLGSMAINSEQITMTQSGVPDTYTCPGTPGP
jgi:hypothetical protein